mmetsp:Transcript_21435/g.44658  ORF Transcript_21435/g.44658 Transcript_21435/m.44658 type:complete len:313 (-) Transcript_21435:41-979(-)
MRRFDVFPRPLEGIVEKSSTAGFFSLIGFAFAGFLLLSEVWQFIRVDIDEHIKIADSITNPTDTIPLKVHISFPHLSCNDLTLDYESTKSDLPSTTSGRLNKRKLNSREKKKVVSQGFKLDDERSKSVGGQRGCTIDGVVDVGRVGGNFKVVITSNVWGALALQGVEELQKGMNVSHYIHDVTFGEHFGKVVNPMREVANGIEEGVGLVQFYMKIIPTHYKRPGRWERETFQISMTEQFVKMSSLLLMGNMQQPGVTFNYDFTPLSVKHTESRENILTFIGSLASVVGGVWVTIGMIGGCLIKATGVDKKLD